jgi:hypothetical protein
MNIHVPEGARAALNLSGTVLRYYPVRVLPSKTAIAPVNPTFLPRECSIIIDRHSFCFFLLRVSLQFVIESKKSQLSSDRFFVP